MNRPARLAVLASGGGTNLQALLDHFNGSSSPTARVSLVLSNRSDAGAIERADKAGVDHIVFDAAAEDLGSVLLERLDAARIDLIVLAGYLKLVPLVVVQRYAGRMINIHPALLPAFGGTGLYGLRVHRAVIDSGATISGATVHLVTERYDEGRILGQWPVPVLPGDSPERLAARVLRAEHALLPAVVEAMVGDRAMRLPAGETFHLTDQAGPAEEQIRSLLDIPDTKD